MSKKEAVEGGEGEGEEAGGASLRLDFLRPGNLAKLHLVRFFKAGDFAIPEPRSARPGEQPADDN